MSRARTVATARRARALACLGLALVVLTPGSTSAQTNNGGFASVVVSALSLEDDTTTSIAATIGYRVNPVLSAGVELTFVPSFRPADRRVPVPFGVFPVPAFSLPVSSRLTSIIVPTPRVNFERVDGHATIFTGILRLAIPTGSSRFEPYLVGGAGVGNVSDELQYSIDYEPVFPLPGGSVFPFPGNGVSLPTLSESIRRSTTDFAMTFGGGVSVMMAEHWSIDGDARYLGITGSRDTHTGRYGGGVTFRF